MAKGVWDRCTPCNMVITDMTMPKMTGEDLSKAIKKICPQMPIILCTGHHGRVQGDESIKKLGADQLVMKPVSFKKLSQIIADLMAKK